MALELCSHIGKSQKLLPVVASEALWPVLHRLHNSFSTPAQFNFNYWKIYLKEFTVLKLQFIVFLHI